jgi:uncharacterized membrane-anchored protein
MNRTQKEAWMHVAISILCSLGFISMAFTTKIAPHPLYSIVLIVLTLITMSSSFIFLRRKQSPAEVDYDERDAEIKRKAIFVSHITLWILLIFGCITSLLIFGQEKTFVIGILPLALFATAIIEAFAYGLTILIQYGWRGNGDK